MAKTDTEIASQLVNALSGEFASYGPSDLEPYVVRARLNVSESFFGDSYDLAVLYMTGHLCTEEIRGGASAGTVQSKSAGELSITYATPDAAYTGAYATTNWGRRYLELVATRRLPIVI